MMVCHYLIIKYHWLIVETIGILWCIKVLKIEIFGCLLLFTGEIDLESISTLSHFFQIAKVMVNSYLFGH